MLLRVGPEASSGGWRPFKGHWVDCMDSSKAPLFSEELPAAASARSLQVKAKLQREKGKIMMKTCGYVPCKQPERCFFLFTGVALLCTCQCVLCRYSYWGQNILRVPDGE